MTRTRAAIRAPRYELSSPADAGFEGKALSLHAPAAEEGAAEPVVGAGRDGDAARHGVDRRADELPRGAPRRAGEPLSAPRPRADHVGIRPRDDLQVNSFFRNPKRVSTHRVVHKLWVT